MAIAMAVNTMGHEGRSKGLVSSPEAYNHILFFYSTAYRWYWLHPPQLYT